MHQRRFPEVIAGTSHRREADVCGGSVAGRWRRADLTQALGVCAGQPAGAQRLGLGVAGSANRGLGVVCELDRCGRAVIAGPGLRRGTPGKANQACAARHMDGLRPCQAAQACLAVHACADLHSFTGTVDADAGSPRRHRPAMTSRRRTRPVSVEGDPRQLAEAPLLACMIRPVRTVGQALPPVIPSQTTSLNRSAGARSLPERSKPRV